MQNNDLRKIEGGSFKHMSKAVGKVIIHTFWKNHVPPKLEEGFSEVIEIPHIPYLSKQQEIA